MLRTIYRSCDAPFAPAKHRPGMVNEPLTAGIGPRMASEKVQVLRTTAAGDNRIFDREKQSAGDVYLAVPVRGQRGAEAHGVFDGSGDVDGRPRVGRAGRRRDRLRRRALVG